MLDCNSEHLVERSWDIECYGTVNKKHPQVLQNVQKRAVEILAKTTKNENVNSVGLL